MRGSYNELLPSSSDFTCEDVARDATWFGRLGPGLCLMGASASPHDGHDWIGSYLGGPVSPDIGCRHGQFGMAHMNQRSRVANGAAQPQKHWSWVQFGFGFVVGGLGTFFTFNSRSSDITVHLMKTAVVALVTAIVAGRFGDSAWASIVRFLVR